MTTDSTNSEQLSHELDECRSEIADIDSQLIELLRRRVDIARKTGVLKREMKLPILDPKREAAVIRRVVEEARVRGLDEEFIREIFWHVLGLSRNAQQEEQA
jgi:chorismate mutase